MTEYMIPQQNRQATLDGPSPETDTPEPETTASKSPGLGVTGKFPAADVPASEQEDQE